MELTLAQVSAPVIPMYFHAGPAQCIAGWLTVGMGYWRVLETSIQVETHSRSGQALTATQVQVIKATCLGSLLLTWAHTLWALGVGPDARVPRR